MRSKVVLIFVALAVEGCAVRTSSRTVESVSVSSERLHDSPSKATKGHGPIVGEASFYAHRFHGRRTANGERFNQHALTAAHLKLPFGTRLKVTNLANGQSVVVRINDRGPYAKKRIIDLSLAAAKKLDMIECGITTVSLEPMPPHVLFP